jgi:hypothetical protein
MSREGALARRSGGMSSPTASRKSRPAGRAGLVSGFPASDLGKLIADETEKWGKVVRAANIKVE